MLPKRRQALSCGFGGIFGEIRSSGQTEMVDVTILETRLQVEFDHLDAVAQRLHFRRVPCGPARPAGPRRAPCFPPPGPVPRGIPATSRWRWHGRHRHAFQSRLPRYTRPISAAVMPVSDSRVSMPAPIAALAWSRWAMSISLMRGPSLSSHAGMQNPSSVSTRCSAADSATACDRSGRFREATRKPARWPGNRCRPIRRCPPAAACRRWFRFPGRTDRAPAGSAHRSILGAGAARKSRPLERRPRRGGAADEPAVRRKARPRHWCPCPPDRLGDGIERHAGGVDPGRDVRADVGDRPAGVAGASHARGRFRPIEGSVLQETAR